MLRHFSRVLAACVVLLGGLAVAADRQPTVVKAEDLTRTYATDPEGFDKSFKGKTVIVEGTVAFPNAQDSISKKSYVMLRGYQKPGDPVDTQVRCESNKSLEGLKAGQKVRIQGTVGPHVKTRFAAELTNCELVKDGK